MKSPELNEASGRVASLHLHPPVPNGSLSSVESVELLAGKGIVGNDRYFGRSDRSSGAPYRRQVSLIAREQIAGHAKELGLESIAPGVVRSNIETIGIDLMALLGKRV